MHGDEERTHIRLSNLLADVINPTIDQFGGRIVKHTGDGFLAEFPSAVEAVRAAETFQGRILELEAAEPNDQRLTFRVGINIGDVIVEAHDIFGDGVNIAARLEAIAEPGGICISGSAYDQVRGKLSLVVTDLGERALKNITMPVKVYAVVIGNPVPSKNAISALSSAPVLSIVVLPFANIGGGPEQDDFVDGVTESLTTDLSRISGSFVIARNTAFTFKNKAIDVKSVGRELNVRYVLEGSVQRGGSRFRVNVQLISAETGNHLWAERFDKPIADLFDMQDEIVSRLANELGAELVIAEAKRAERELNPNALNLCFQGMAWIYKGPTRENMAVARDYFERALLIDPNSIHAQLGKARVETGLGSTFVDETRWKHFAEAEPILTSVLAAEPSNATAHLFLGIVLVQTKRVAAGIAECERALTLDRNMANALGVIAYAKQLIGRAEETETYVKEAERLSPRDIFAFRWLNSAGVSKLLLADWPSAVTWLRRCIEANRNYSIAYIHLAAALALSGEEKEARTVAAAALSLDPTFSVLRYRKNSASDHPQYLEARERIYEGLRIAGLPEG